MGIVESTLRTDINKQSISDFTKYDTYIKEHIKEKQVNNNNIVSLECKKDDTERISYMDSAFDKLSKKFMGYYQKKDGTFLITVPSFCNVFQNDNSYNGYFLEESIIFTSNLYHFIKIDYNDENENKYILDINFSHMLFTEELDYYLIKYLKKFLENLKIIKIFDKIISLCDTNKSVCSICYGKDIGNNITHGVAIIFWKDEISKEYFCGIYDPMYYERKDSSYTLIVNTMYIMIRLLSINKEIKLKILNLSKLFCINDERKGIHCVQYIIDAQYCSIYSLYFLFLYAKANFPKDLNDIKKVVHNTFISENPIDIKRNPCKKTNEFRLVMMSFILTVLLLISDDISTLKLIKKIYDDVNSNEYFKNNKIIKKSNYSLIHPNMLLYLEDEIKRLESVNTIGGRRKYSRIRKYSHKRKNSHKRKKSHKKKNSHKR